MKKYKDQPSSYYDDDDGEDQMMMKIRTEGDGMMTSQTSAMITGGMTDCWVDY